MVISKPIYMVNKSNSDQLQPCTEIASVYIANYRAVKTSDPNHTCKQKLPKEEKENLKSGGRQRFFC